MIKMLSNIYLAAHCITLDSFINDDENESRNAKIDLFIKYSIFAHIQWGGTSIIKLICELGKINVVATFENYPRMFTDLRALTSIFIMRSWKTR